MTDGDTAMILGELRKARIAVSRPGAPSEIDLRGYVPKGSPAWNEFVRIRGKTPGYSVRRDTMIQWLDEVIGKLDGAVLNLAPAPSTTVGTPLRQLTPDGIEQAQEFLEDLRRNPEEDREPPEDLLRSEGPSQPFNNEIVLERGGFRTQTRREVGAYLAKQLDPVKHLVTDDAGVWSWLGMYYFADVVRVKDGRVQLHADETSLFLGGRAKQRRYRHYLWAAWRAWRLHEQHGEAVAYFLDQPATDSGDIAKAILDYPRVYTSIGIVPLILRLYTDGQQTKSGFSVRARKGKPPPKPGNIWHLIERVLPQLELTYDVYGMEPDALLRILPEPFRAWDRADAAGPSG